MRRILFVVSIVFFSFGNMSYGADLTPAYQKAFAAIAPGAASLSQNQGLDSNELRGLLSSRVKLLSETNPPPYFDTSKKIDVINNPNSLIGYREDRSKYYSDLYGENYKVAETTAFNAATRDDFIRKELTVKEPVEGKAGEFKNTEANINTLEALKTLLLEMSKNGKDMNIPFVKEAFAFLNQHMTNEEYNNLREEFDQNISDFRANQRNTSAGDGNVVEPEFEHGG